MEYLVKKYADFSTHRLFILKQKKTNVEMPLSEDYRAITND